jgi:hypothetical protein
MAVFFYAEAVGHGDAARYGRAANIVAAKVEQHQMLGAFLGVSEQSVAVGGVFGGIGAARAGARNRADGDFAAPNADKDFGAGPDHRKARQVEIIKEGRWVDTAKRAVKLKRRQRERRGKALRQYHLEYIASDDMRLRGQHHVAVMPIG